MNNTHGRGFVLARYDRGESDLFVELLLDDGEIKRAVARGGARSSRRFSAGLSPFTLYRVVFGRTRLTTHDRLDEASVERAFPGVLGELRRTASAGAASVLARDLVREGAPDPGLYASYAALLETLERADGAAAGAALLRFALEAFERAGHPIVLDACVRCGREAPDNALVKLSPGAGGVVCGACGGGPYALRAAERRAVRAIRAGEGGGFDGGMLRTLARLVEPHARRGADAMDGAAAHWG